MYTPSTEQVRLSPRPLFVTKYDKYIEIGPQSNVSARVRAA